MSNGTSLIAIVLVTIGIFLVASVAGAIMSLIGGTINWWATISAAGWGVALALFALD